MPPFLHGLPDLASQGSWIGIPNGGDSQWHAEGSDRSAALPEAIGTARTP